MTTDPWDDSLFVDANACLAERIVVRGRNVIVHYCDVPETDITLVRGVRCTNALRTVIDMASQLRAHELAVMVQDCLDRGLFTIDEAWERISRTDMIAYPGASSLRQFLSEHLGDP